MNPSGGEQYGYDVHFIGDVSDNLKCIVCHLVMRKPVQIMTCGHRFCKACFERFKGYNENLASPLCCPVDREVIDINKIFDDNGVARDIGNLQVRCLKEECSWVGDLRDVENHEVRCQLKVEEEVVVSCQALNELYQRISKCEESSLSKEKDIAYLKYNFSELKKTFNAKEAEVITLKEKNGRLEEEVMLLKERYQESKKQFERDFENLSLKYQLVEKRMDTGEKAVMQVENTLAEQQDDFKAVKGDIKDIQVKIENLNLNVNNAALETKATFFNDMQRAEEKVTNSIADMKFEFEKKLTEKSEKVTKLNVQMEEQFKVKSDTIEKKLGDNIKRVEEVFNDLQNYMTQDDVIMQIENNEIINASKETFQWRVQNFQQHFEQRKQIFSPEFYSCKMHGFSFKLSINWVSGNDNTGVYLHMCCGETSEYEQVPYKFAYEIVLVGKDGFLKPNNEPAEYVDAKMEVKRKNALTIKPGEKISTDGWGWAKFLSVAEQENFIINNMLVIQCNLTNKI